jgi:hypothetical protein
VSDLSISSNDADASFLPAADGDELKNIPKSSSYLVHPRQDGFEKSGVAKGYYYNMSWFYNLKVIKKLMFGIGLMAIELCLVGYMGMNNMRSINRNLETMYSSHILGIAYFRNVGLDLRAIASSLRSDIDASENPKLRDTP